MKKDLVALGIDIGGTNTKMGLFNQAGDLMAYKSLPTPHQAEPELFIQQLAQEGENILQEKLGIPLGHSSLIGVGIGAPMANFFTGEVSYAPNLGWKNVPLKKLAEKYFKIPATIENDANLAAYGEKKWGAGKEFSDFVLITLGTGVGTGLIFNSKLYRGHNALGAEGGHILIPNTSQRSCSCGGINHLESYLSAKGIKQTIHETTGQEWTIEHLGNLFKNQDTQATAVIHKIAHELASGLTSIAVLVGPQAFVIGGGVSKLGESFNQVVAAKLDELVHYSLKGKMKIVSAMVSTDKGAIYGGAAQVFDNVSEL